MKRSIKRATLAIAALTAPILASGAAVAGGLAAPIAEPTVIAPVVVQNPGMDWTGFYAGLQYGKFDTDVSGLDVAGSTRDNGAGLHFGYLQDMGQYVVGGELTYDRPGDIDLLRLRGKLGYDAGRVLPYVTAGFAKAKASDSLTGTAFNENGYTYGIGVDFAVTDNVLMGLEYSRQTFDDLGGVSGLKADTDALQLRVSYKF